ncbi:unnamed protein product [Ectocarpus sp. 6 AP-2014]
MAQPAVAHGGDNARRDAPHWTHTYDKWDGWEDPDELAKKREEEEKRAKSYRENHMACAHDRSAERKVMEMPIEEKISACRDFRQRGNLFHAEGQYRRGALQYRQALIYYDFCFPDEDSQQQELDDIRQACLLNSAACFLACGELDQTLDCCYQASCCLLTHFIGRALRAEPNNIKALYRRAVVYRLRDRFKEASVDLGKALAQRPHEVMLRKESAVLKSKIASYRERRKAMGEQIFGKEQGRDQDNVRGSSNYNGRASQQESETQEKDDSEPPAAEAAEDYPYQCFAPAAAGGGNESGGGYAVTAAVVPAGSGRGEEEEGRRWHDLVSPVCVDLSPLEDMAGCAWPIDA